MLNYLFQEFLIEYNVFWEILRILQCVFKYLSFPKFVKIIKVKIFIYPHGLTEWSPNICLLLRSYVKYWAIPGDIGPIENTFIWKDCMILTWVVETYYMEYKSCSAEGRVL